MANGMCIGISVQFDNTVVVVYVLGVIEDWMKKQDQLCDKQHEYAEKSREK